MQSNREGGLEERMPRLDLAPGRYNSSLGLLQICSW